MRIKITHPVSFDGKRFEAGETIDAPKGKALEIIGIGWAIEVAEDKRKKVKHDKRQDS